MSFTYESITSMEDITYIKKCVSEQWRKNTAHSQVQYIQSAAGWLDLPPKGCCILSSVLVSMLAAWEHCMAVAILAWVIERMHSLQPLIPSPLFH